MPKLSPSDLTECDRIACPEELVHVANHVQPSPRRSESSGSEPSGSEPSRSEPRKIPRVVHQTSRSRCLTPRLAELMKAWRLPGHDYYLHDDVAVDWLLTRTAWPMFPHLTSVAKCLTQGTLRADLWRYLVLYEYGGIYADIDSTPNAFDGSQIAPDADAFFIVEMYQTLSQYFMAASPRHPILFYAIHDALISLLQAPDVAGINAAYNTGPHALYRGFQAFMRDAGVEIPHIHRGDGAVEAGTYVGTDGRSITVVGSPSTQNELVMREAIRRGEKIKEYRKMSMTHFTQDAKRSSGVSMLRALYELEKQASAQKT